MGIIYILLIGSGSVFAQEMGLKRMPTEYGVRHQARMHMRAGDMRHTIYDALYNTSASEFARVLREHDIITDMDFPITIFAPSNTAVQLVRFRDMDTQSQKAFIRSHIVSGAILPNTVAGTAHVMNMHGSKLRLVYDMQTNTYTVNDAPIQAYMRVPGVVIYLVDNTVVDR